MQIIFYIGIFLLGAFLAKFANVFITSYQRDYSINLKYCEKCREKKMSLIDFIPFIDIFKGMKCDCTEKIKLRYAVVEIIYAIFCVVVYYKFGNSTDTLKYLVYIFILLICTGTDIESMIISPELNVVGAVFAVVINFLTGSVSIKDMAIALAIGFIPMFLLSLIGAMGEGDAWLLGMIGLFIGWKMLLACLFVAVMIGGVSASILLIVKKRRGEFAFGPSICAAAVIVIFYGTQLINWYLNYIGVK